MYATSQTPTVDKKIPTNRKIKNLSNYIILYFFVDVANSFDRSGIFMPFLFSIYN